MAYLMSRSYDIIAINRPIKPTTDMPRQGHKSTAGVGDLWDEPKSRTTLILTETARTALDERAAKLGISRSELVEQFARGIIGLPEQETAAKKSKRSRNFTKSG